MAEKPSIDLAQVHHIAKLAALSLSDAEATKLVEELGAIVAYVAQLDSLDTTDVPATANVQLDRAAWRGDELAPGLSHEDALAQAPRVAQGGFAVPLFVES